MLRILVPVEDVAFGKAQLKFLASHKLPADAIIFLLAVVKPFALQDYGFAMPHLSTSLAEADLKQATLLLDELSEFIGFYQPRTKIVKITSSGNPIAEILHEIQKNQIDSVILGSHGRSGLDRYFLGSVSQAVANRAPCSVTIVRFGQDDGLDEAQTQALERAVIPLKTIMLALDERKFASAQLRMLDHHALENTGKILLVAVKTPIAVYDYGAIIPQKYMEELEKEEEALITNLMDEAEFHLKERLPELLIEKVRVTGDPKVELLNIADANKVDWIIMGSHGRSGLDRFFLGSVSQAVVNRALCSVSIVRNPDDVMKELEPNSGSIPELLSN